MESFVKHGANPLVLLLIDGWGIAARGEGNAIAQAALPNFNELAAKYPSLSVNTGSLGKTAAPKADIARNYSALGTGKIKPTKESRSFFDVLDEAGLSWIVITEAEKFAYAAFFLNNKKKMPKEKYRLIDSEIINNYAFAPEMSTFKITAELLKIIKSRKYDFILADFANLDLVAHAGEAADLALGKIIKTVLDNSATLFFSAACGNAEAAKDMATEISNKKHTLNPVPLIIAGKGFEGKTFGFPEAPGNDLSLVAPAGSLIDIAPTILRIMGLEIPAGMEGKPLI